MSTKAQPPAMRPSGRALPPTSPLSQPPAPRAPDPSQLRALIKRNLPDASRASVTELMRSVTFRTLRADDFVWRRGERIPLTLLTDGFVAFNRAIADGRQLTVGIGYPGRIYGISSVSSTIAAVDVIALTDVEIGQWPPGSLRSLVERDPAIGLDVLDQLSTYANLLTIKLDGYLHQDARGRVMRTLVRHGELFFGDRPILSRAILPGLVGTSREMTGRVLRDLERDGIIVRVGRTGLRVSRQDWLEAGAIDAEEDELAAPGAWPAMVTTRRRRAAVRHGAR